MQLEPALAGLAAMRAVQQDVRNMRDLCDRIARARDDDARELWDEALHRTIGRAAGNALLFGLYEIIEEVRRDEVWRGLRERARSRAMVATLCRAACGHCRCHRRRDPGAAEQGDAQPYRHAPPQHSHPGRSGGRPCRITRPFSQSRIFRS